VTQAIFVAISQATVQSATELEALRLKKGNIRAAMAAMSRFTFDETHEE
jgi:hypothetical protein